MVKNVIIAFSATYLVLLGFPLLVAAQDSQDTELLQEVVTQNNNEVSSSRQAERTLEERVNQIKERATEQISEAQQRRIQTRCSTAQERVNNLRTRLSDSIERRRDAYSSVSTKLNELVLKLQAAGVDSSELNTAITEMDTLLTNSRLSVDNYMQNLADITEMDCASDPTGFKAILEDARAKRAEITASQTEIKTLKDEKLKPALQTIRESFNATINTQESGE